MYEIKDVACYKEYSNEINPSNSNDYEQLTSFRF